MEGHRLGVLVGGSKYLDPRSGKDVFHIDLLDLDDGGLRSVAVDFLAHGMTTLPGRPEIAAFFEKRGPDACVVDLARARLLRPIVAGSGRAFYGHGIFAPDGGALYSVEIRKDTHEGVLTIRDPRTFDPKGELPTFGLNPHDCVLCDDQRTLAITNGGGALGAPEKEAAPSVAFVDLSTRRLVEKVVFGDPKINAGHVALAKNGDLAVVSAPRDGLPEATSLGGLTLRVARRKAERVREPRSVTSRMLGESLSVTIHDASRTVAATHPLGNLVTFWDLDRGKLRAAVDLPGPRGVTLTADGARFVVSYGQDGSIAQFDAATLAPAPGGREALRSFSGSHVFTWTPADVRPS